MWGQKRQFGNTTPPLANKQKQRKLVVKLGRQGGSSAVDGARSDEVAGDAYLEEWTAMHEGLGFTLTKISEMKEIAQRFRR